MHRYFLRIIIYIFSLYLFIVFGESQIIWASSSNDNKHTSTSDKLSMNKASQTEKRKIEQSSKHDPVLVPPPPPDQPSLLEWSNMTMMPESFNLLNEEELKQKLDRIKTDIEAAQASINETNIEVEESKTRAERFISLYSEGVVSRNELEIAKKSVSRKERLTQEAKGKLEDLKVQENAILRRLANFKKTTKVKQNSIKKKIANSEKTKQ